MSDRVQAIDYNERASREKQVLADAIKQRWPNPDQPPSAEVMLLMETAAAVHTWGGTIATLLSQLISTQLDSLRNAKLVCQRCPNQIDLSGGLYEIDLLRAEARWPWCHGLPMTIQVELPKSAAEVLVAS